MVHGYSLDPHPRANYAEEVYAVVRIPRLKRERVPSGSVTVVEEIEEALQLSDPDNNLYAARLVGPARSSEGVELYYIVEIYS